MKTENTPLETFSPTFKFRFVERTEEVNPYTVRVEKFLQQMHQGNAGTQIWIDVPTENEN